MRMKARNFDRHAALRRPDIDTAKFSPRKSLRECLRREQASRAHSIQEDVPRAVSVVQGRITSVAEDALRRSGAQRLGEPAPVLIVARIHVLKQCANVERLVSVEIGGGIRRIGVAPIGRR